jgi:hypothetical protein
VGSAADQEWDARFIDLESYLEGGSETGGPEVTAEAEWEREWGSRRD